MTELLSSPKQLVPGLIESPASSPLTIDYSRASAKQGSETSPYTVAWSPLSHHATADGRQDLTSARRRLWDLTSPGQAAAFGPLVDIEAVSRSLPGREVQGHVQAGTPQQPSQQPYVPRLTAKEEKRLTKNRHVEQAYTAAAIPA